MAREGVDLDMKLPSTLREVFKYENKYIFSRKNSPGRFKLTLQTVVSCQDQPPSLAIARFLLQSLVCAQTLMPRVNYIEGHHSANCRSQTTSLHETRNQHSIDLPFQHASVVCKCWICHKHRSYHPVWYVYWIRLTLI